MQMDHPVINAGGGFPWPYGTDGEGSSLSELRAELEALLHAAREKVPALQLAFESGRYLSASCGTLVTAVLDVKQSGSKTFVILDTGIHHLGGMSGLGRIPRASLAMKLLNGAGGKLITVDVVGPLCSPLDALARGVTMAEPKPGDLIAIPNVGAYGLSASLVDFLSHPRPVELAIRAGELETSTPPTSA
jgi:diaminopimelate decarboxylase